MAPNKNINMPMVAKSWIVVESPRAPTKFRTKDGAITWIAPDSIVVTEINRIITRINFVME